jgi:hypothetical protein
LQVLLPHCALLCCAVPTQALTCVGSAEDDCQDNKALTRCVLADNIVQTCSSCDKHNCCEWKSHQLQLAAARKVAQLALQLQKLLCFCCYCQ